MITTNISGMNYEFERGFINIFKFCREHPAIQNSDIIVFFEVACFFTAYQRCHVANHKVRFHWFAEYFNIKLTGRSFLSYFCPHGN